MDTLHETRCVIATTAAMRLMIDGREAPLSSRKSLAVLVYIALQSSRMESRERIAALLWSDSGPDQARAALRQTLRRLKADLGTDGDLVEADRSVIRLTRPVTLDIAEALVEAEAGRAPRLLAAEKADLARLFADLEDLDPDFNLWIAVQRERLTAQLIARLEAALAAAPDPAERLRLAEALLRADPTHEGATRAAMEAHLASGDVPHALKAYERLWAVLDEDLDVEPSEKTQALYVAIKQGQFQPAALRPPEPDLLAPVAIVVEPTNQSGLPSDFAYFGEIFRSEMISALSRFRDWLVIDGPHEGAPPPAYRAYNLRITVLSQSGGLAVSMMLVDREDGRCVWAERASATLDTMALLHRTALRNLAVALNIHLSTPRLQTARDVSSPIGHKYELWMQAQALGGEWRADAEARAETILRDLITSTPNFAPAMVALAQILNARPIVYAGRSRRPEHLEESLALTARAVALDPLDSRTHLSRSWSHAIAGVHSAALAHLDLALDLNENDPWTIVSAALGFAFAGELDRARALVEQARIFGMKFSRAAQGYIAVALYLTEDCKGSAEAAEIAGDAIINLPAWQAACRIRTGDATGAAASMRKFLSLARAAWPGQPAPTGEDVIAWFMGCFPIRSEEVRSRLRAELSAALAETKKRRD